MAALFNNNSSVVVSKDKNKSEKLCSKYKCNPSYKLLLLTVFSTGHVSVVRKKWEEWLLVVFFFHSQSCFCLALDLVLNLNINLKYCSLATRSNSKSWNHDVFEGLWGKVCVLVWLRGEKKIRNGVTETPPYNLNQLFDADWPWHLQYGLSLPSALLQGAFQETHTLAYHSRLFVSLVPSKVKDRRCYIQSTENIRSGVYSVLSQHPQ